jgi:adenylosuccinate lyase
MIERYSRPEMRALWEEETKLKTWLEVELRVLLAMAEEGLINKDLAQRVVERANFSLARTQEIEALVRHDVIAFLTNVAEVVGEEARFLHRGLTSNDLLDTALAVVISRSRDIILKDVDDLLKVLKDRAIEFKNTPCIGRSHGIHAEPTTFGLKILSWYTEISRAKERIQSAFKEVCVGKIAGAVGTYSSVSMEVEKKVLDFFSLGVEEVPSQVVHRDRHAALLSSFALLASSIERVCVEIRHLQRSEVREVEEGFAAGQKGSSAMPHKRNPIATENLTGISRLIRSYSLAALENIPLWHERDISHSSVERVALPDVFILLDYQLARLNQVIKNLAVFPDRMMKNINLTNGLIFSGSVLLALVDKGFTRESAYEIVQQNSMKCWHSEGEVSLLSLLNSDERVLTKFNKDEIASLFNLNGYLINVNNIFNRVFN